MFVSLLRGEKVQVKVANLLSSCVSPSDSWQGEKKGGGSEMIRFIYQADLSGVAAASACFGVPLIWCLTRSRSGSVSSDKYIHHFLLSAHILYQY